MLLILTLHESIQYDSHTNSAILSRRLYGSFACCFCLFLSSFFVNAATTVNVDEWYELLESFLSIVSIFLNLWIWMSGRMNQTYFECYEFDVNVVLILIVTYTYTSMLNWVRMNQSSWISTLLTHSYSKFHEHLWVVKKRFIDDLRLTGHCVMGRHAKRRRLLSTFSSVLISYEVQI